MTIRNLDHALHPRSVAVIGASQRPGAVGTVVLNNILAGGFEGDIWPVNPKYRHIGDLPCHGEVKDIPGVPDLAVIITPPASVPALIHALGEKGTRAAVVITAGLSESNGLRQAMLDAAKPYLFRIIGPNTVGLVIPPAKLNASFSHMGAEPGNIALLSQSGAIAVSLIDWAADNQLGFSQIVSLGDMADVDVGDFLDLLARDPRTRAIVMYLESIPSPRKFMSAARAAARLKPVIVIKPGRHKEAAKAAATHTGALSGSDRVVEAVFARAGVLRVGGLGELFDATETISRFRPLTQLRTAIVTNGGGAGVLAVDQLMDGKGVLAELSEETIMRLNAVLPANWSHGNPVDIIGDAPPERYTSALAIVAADPGVDALMVLNCPTGLASAEAAAHAVASLAKQGLIEGKPVLSCWLGEHTAREGRRILQDSGVASYETPAATAVAMTYLSSWSRTQALLTRVPQSESEIPGDGRKRVEKLLRQVAAEGRRMLTEPEAKAAIQAYGIPVPDTFVASSIEDVEVAAAQLLESADKIVVKLLSKTITHKSDIGGVVLNIETPEAARDAAAAIARRLQDVGQQSAIEGYAVQPMIARSRAQELILGINRDPLFGPVILFGAGGVSVEVVDDTAIGLPPLDDVLAGDLIDQTRIARLLAGYRDRKPADRPAIIGALLGLSQMIVDFPCIVAMDINPLLADSDGIIALDARVEIEPAEIDRTGPNPDLIIQPYPSGWSKEVERKGNHYRLRPIRPADAALYETFLRHVSQDDMRLRFFSTQKSVSEDMLVRLTQLDYDRDMAFIALDPSGELAGVARISADPDHQIAEYGILVRSNLQGQGLGWALLQQLIEYGRADGLHRIDGVILRENTRMLQMCRELGFNMKTHPEEPTLTLASLHLR
ncbi:acetyltransferase [Rhodoligotrophos appendicifer]|uniref:bifunctional acetate--CoA ligase family protein/GNAT family N-acetyltransferase n=1 Tax=Rhodoligotrophos appendicifer TaxID=987056 RepID=UPI001184964E|nr:bifunctional acetate--CoA ligase family protein/GNAT family N-acetyltransferase [Rhodoligotrophos appendicifer]